MRAATKGLLVLSSLFNAAIGFVVFFFALFATNPQMSDVTMRVGFYVLNGVALAAAAGVILPWLFATRENNRRALFFSLLPALLLCLAVLAFLTLDSWLNRTFGN